MPTSIWYVLYRNNQFWIDQEFYLFGGFFEWGYATGLGYSGRGCCWWCIWDAHIEHETKKLFVVSFFLRRKKNKNPPLLWRRDRPNRKTKNSTRSRARWPGVRTVYIAFRVSAVIVTVCVFQSATFLLQFDSVFQFFLHSIQIISFGCCCFFLVNHAGCAGTVIWQEVFLTGTWRRQKPLSLWSSWNGEP